MIVREYMFKNGGNMGWCRPFLSLDDKYAIVVKDGAAICMMINGQKIDDVHGNMQGFAKAVNPNYDNYFGWTDLQIALDTSDMREHNCMDCPWNDVCELMNEELEGEIVI